MTNELKAVDVVAGVLDGATEGLYVHQIAEKSELSEDVVKHCLRTLATQARIEMIPARGRWGNRYAALTPTKPVLPPAEQETDATMKPKENAPATVESDGSTASYYELPEGATELQHLISARDMNAQIGEIFRACYRYGKVAHSPKARDIKKIIFYAQAELDRLEKLG